MSEVCKPCPHFPGYYSGYQYSDVSCPLCRSEARIRELEAALESLIVNTDLHGHLGLHPNHPSVQRARALLPQTETSVALPPNWTICGACGTEWVTSDGAVLPCPKCSEAKTKKGEQV